jgi:short-subunit dehydrogenase
VLAEGLWAELKTQGIDVLACEAGATLTPNFERSMPKDQGASARPMDPGEVAETALSALGKRPSVIPGRFNRFAFAAMRLMPRSRAIRLISATTRKMYGA